MGLADVLLAWAVLLAVEAVDLIAADFYPAYGYPVSGYTPIGVGFLAAAIVMWRHPRTGAGLAALVGLVALLGPVSSTMTSFIMWCSAAIWLFDRYRAEALRWLVVAVYGFAAFNKLLGPFLSGSIIANHAPWLPNPMLFAVVAVAFEFWLAVVVWRRWKYAPLAIIAFHVPVAVLVAATPHHAARLMLYGVMVAWAAWVSGDVSTRAGRARRESAELAPA